MQTNHRSLAWIAATAFFMQTLDSTILTTALPAISIDLQQSPLQMQLTVISYALTVALFIPMSGWMADKYGTLTIFRFSVSTFVLGSICCAFSTSLEMLIFSRILQGFGGAMMMPVARLAIIRIIPKNELLPVLNLMAMAGLTGPILGPVLGGWLSTYASWHWIFLINIPIGLLGVLLAHRFMPNLRNKVKKFDWQGFFLFAGGLVGFTLGLDLLGEAFLPQWQSGLIILIGMFFLLSYYLYAKNKSDALIPLSLFKVRTYLLGSWANLFIRLCGSGIPFLLPLMLQLSFHYDADIAGWLVSPIALSSLAVKPFIRKLLFKLSYKKALIYTALLMILSIISMALLKTDSSLWLYLLLVSIYGFCLSVLFTAVNTLTISELDQQTASAGATMLSVVQQVGIGLGIAIAAIALNFYREYVDQQQLQQAFSYTFLTCSSFGLWLLFVVFKLHKNDGSNLH